MSHLLPYQERVLTEHREMEVKVQALRALIATEAFRQVDRAERKRLLVQESLMTELVRVLAERIAAFPSGPDGT